MLGLLAMVLPQVGKGPSDKDLQAYMSSRNFDAERGTFVNRRHDEYERMMNSFDLVKLSKENFFGKETREPPEPFPIIGAQIGRNESVRKCLYLVGAFNGVDSSGWKKHPI